MLAGLALALGSLAPHDLSGKETGPVLTPTVVAENARHPGDPTHFEQSSSEIHHGCVACLLQIETHGPAADPPVSAAPPLDWNAKPDVVAEWASSPCLRRAGPPRAPPSSSLAA